MYYALITLLSLYSPPQQRTHKVGTVTREQKRQNGEDQRKMKGKKDEDNRDVTNKKGIVIQSASVPKNLFVKIDSLLAPRALVKASPS